MKKISVSACCLFLILSLGHYAIAANITGKWEASVMGHKVKAVAEQKGNKISGVAYVYDPFGNKNPWHFKGTIQGDKIQAAHDEGHRFVGKIVDAGKLSGVLETNNGFRIPLDIYSVR